MSQPLCSVVICHHRGDLILRCLESVQKSQGVSFETLLITSDSTLHERCPRWPDLYFVEGGPAHKRNVGVARSKADLIVFLDDDVEISPYCLYEFFCWMRDHPSCGMAFGKIYKMAEGRRDEFDACGSWLTWTGFLWDRAGNGIRDVGQFEEPERILSSKSATCVIRRSTFFSAGGFDASYYILGEETLLSYNVWLGGKEVWYVPSAISWHAFGCESLKPKQDFYTLKRIHFLGCRNYLNLLTTNPGWFRSIQMLSCQLVMWSVAAAGFACQGQWMRGWMILRGIADWFMRLPSTLKKRNFIQAKRVISDSKLLPIILRNPPNMYYLSRLLRYLRQGLHG